jgi:hypothetical protein
VFGLFALVLKDGPSILGCDDATINPTVFWIQVGEKLSILYPME